MKDFLFRGSIADLDNAVEELAELEAERQNRRLILIPSESTAPLAVRKALSSAFHNVYAEGYPDQEMRALDEAGILDYDNRLAHYRRYSDPRYYKGVEYVDFVESLAGRRCADVFAANGVSSSDIFVNVQALSGAPANNAVYHALIDPGDTIMGMNLLHGGHLSHGSSVNRSGKYYNAVHYTVDADTEKINYDAVEELAKKHSPKVIIAGYSSYPWSIDWSRFRSIADSVGAYLFADIAHVAGLVAARVYPSPVGFADVITFTTHKSMCGPRGACILTTKPSLARKIDRAVFPGEQGGPHTNVFAAMAITFKLAQTEQFRELQKQIVKNCKAFTKRFVENGFRVPFGGTDTHLMNLDCSTIKNHEGVTLSGDQASRILDLAGIVVNRNTIPGDKSALDPSGIRMGTPWITQRGFKRVEMIELADMICDLLKATIPYSQQGRRRNLRRAKVDFNVLESTKIKARDLVDKAGRDIKTTRHTYPHYFYLDDVFTKSTKSGWTSLTLSGDRVRGALHFVLTSDIDQLKVGDSQSIEINIAEKCVEGTITSLSSSKFRLDIHSEDAGLAATWLRDLSDGFVDFDEDKRRKIPGPFIVSEAEDANVGVATGSPVCAHKPYYIGMSEGEGESLPGFNWDENEEKLQRTPIYATHKALGAKVIPFAGWEMPVWYTSVIDEHTAVREAAGLFDVAHMGVYQAEGPHAAVFLDCVVGNDIGGLGVGESCYTHLLDPSANVIDDLLIYRRERECYLIVVNASNDQKDWTWLNAVRDGEVCVDQKRPWVKVYGRNVILRNLRDEKEGGDMRVDIALQGPRSRDVLLALDSDTENRRKVSKLKRTQLCDAVIGGFDLVVSRTGYTGEKMAFELFVHPDKTDDLFNTLLHVGEPFGVKPVGLGARDSLRTEAGLPLYGHEMGGEKNLGVAEAGFGWYVKTYKPWFIGRRAFLHGEDERNGIVVRFRFNDKRVRMAHNTDPVLDKRGKVIGWVTSCAIDSEGYLTGQAFVSKKYSTKGNQIFIYQSAAKIKTKDIGKLHVGDRTTIPSQATVVDRFHR